MNCPKCNLVTFDHLPKCPRCRTSFELKRRLTRPRRDPSRAILIPVAPNDRPEPNAKDAAMRARPIAPPVEPEPAVQSPATSAAWAPTAQPTPTPPQAPTTQPTPTPPQTPTTQPTPTLPQTPTADLTSPQAASSDELQVADRRRLKERMVRASQARRRARPDLVTQVADPSLPDWYEPAPTEAREPRAAVATSTKNRTR